MKITVITGTEVQGCTYQLKEAFLSELRQGNEIKEFYLPRDNPHFCRGCKLCFDQHEDKCPHAAHVRPIWNAIADSDLIVWAYPVYVMRAPGHVKALLDHFGCHWMPHRPDPRMFSKTVAIITQSIGAPNNGAQADVATSMTWLGVPRVKKIGFGLIDGTIWEELKPKRRENFIKKTKAFAHSFKNLKPAKMSLVGKTIFAVCRKMQQNQLKKTAKPSADAQYWLDQGWIKVR
jgi:multimeric flavodoxin WrbA